MNHRLKVLISAYACEYGKGSEPEVGWQWSMQMARYHDVTVLTRANNQKNIELALAQLPPDQPRPQFVYFDGSARHLRLKAKFKIHRIYYIWWQKAARKVVSDLCAENHYDLLHHVTFAGFRYTTAIWGNGVKCIWGPIGGMESIYWRLLPYRYPRELLTEFGRNLNNLIQSAPSAAFPKRLSESDLTIASTRETLSSIERWGQSGVLMPTIGLDLTQFPEREHFNSDRPLRLLFVGQMIWLKGCDLAIEALAASGSHATLSFIGGGPMRSKLERLAERKGISDQIQFVPRIPREEVLRRFYDYDVFIFPSLHDSGGFAVIEAMAAGLPVICLDVGGPVLSVVEGCGFRCPLASRSTLIRNLADHIMFYQENRATLAQHGQNARSQIKRHYDWSQKGVQMNALYQSCTTRKVMSKPKILKPAIISLIILLLVSMVGIIAPWVSAQKGKIIENHTLPSLAHLSLANQYRGEAFFHLLRAMNAPEQRAFEAERRMVDQLSKQSLNELEACAASATTPEHLKLLDELMSERDAYVQIRQNVMTQVDHGNRDEAFHEMTTRLLPIYERYLQKGNELANYSKQQGVQEIGAMRRVGFWSQIFAVIASVVLFVLGFFFGFTR